MGSIDMTLAGSALDLDPGRAPAWRRAEVVAGVGEAQAATAGALAGLPGEVAWLRTSGERRPPAGLRGHFAGGLILGCPDRDGDGDGDGPAGRERLLRAADGYDLVELDADRDLSPEVLAAVPPRRRLVCWRGPATDAEALGEVFRRLSATEARYYRMVVEGRTARDGLAPLEFLRKLGRRDVVAYADGEAGLWSHVLAPMLGAPLVFGAFAGGSERAADPDVRRLVEDYGFPVAPAAAMVFGIVGGHVSGSLSPRLHNAAYRWLGIPAVFLPFPVEAFEMVLDRDGRRAGARAARPAAPRPDGRVAAQGGRGRPGGSSAAPSRSGPARRTWSTGDGAAGSPNRATRRACSTRSPAEASRAPGGRRP